MNDRDNSSRRFLACTVQQRRPFGTRLCCSSWTHGESPFVSSVSIIYIYSKHSRTISRCLNGSLPTGTRRSNVQHFSRFTVCNWPDSDIASFRFAAQKRSVTRLPVESALQYTYRAYFPQEIRKNIANLLAVHPLPPFRKDPPHFGFGFLPNRRDSFPTR